MKKLSKIILALLAFLCTSDHLFAQAKNADFMRSMGKMYVVVAVIIAIFIGVVFFLVYLDRRLTKLEHQINLDDE